MVLCACQREIRVLKAPELAALAGLKCWVPTPAEQNTDDPPNHQQQNSHIKQGLQVFTIPNAVLLTGNHQCAIVAVAD